MTCWRSIVRYTSPAGHWQNARLQGRRALALGVHSGRRQVADGLGRVGAQHCTEGCIRVADEDMATPVGIHLGNTVLALAVTA